MCLVWDVSNLEKDASIFTGFCKTLVLTPFLIFGLCLIAFFSQEITPG